jgi:hypothetical protein
LNGLWSLTRQFDGDDLLLGGAEYPPDGQAGSVVFSLLGVGGIQGGDYEFALGIFLVLPMLPPFVLDKSASPRGWSLLQLTGRRVGAEIPL